MKIGVSAIQTASGPAISDVARRVEALGFESLWMGEHIVLPVEIENPLLYGQAPLPESYRHMPDPIVWLTAACAVTERLKVGFDVCLVPQRNPLVLAKQLACMDVISNGRVILGAGAGWIPEEARIMGYERKQRWSRMMEHLQAIKQLWTEETPSFAGEHVSFPPVYSYPKPVQRPHPPILIGAGSEFGNNEPTLRRIAEVADGWLPVYMPPERMAEDIATLRTLCEERGRDFDAMDISLLVPGVNLGIGEAYESMDGIEQDVRDTSEMIAQYEEAGVTRIIVGLVDLELGSWEHVLQEAADGLGLS